MNKIYWGWYKCIGNDANNEIVRVEAKDWKLRNAMAWKFIALD